LVFPDKFKILVKSTIQCTTKIL